MDAPFLGFWRHLLLPVGPGTHGRPASRAFCQGRGPFGCPLTGPFHTHFSFFPRPRFFFSFFLLFGPSGPDATDSQTRVSHWMEFVFREWDTEFRGLLREYSGIEFRSWIPRAAPRNPAKDSETPTCLVFFYIMEGEILSVFFGWCFFRRLSLFTLRFLQSSTCLRFFVRRVFRNELWDGSPEFLGRIFGPKKSPFLRPENGKDKVLPFLGIFRSSIFVTARFCGGFWATNSVICIGCFFAGSGCAVFVWIFFYLIQGFLVFLPFSGLWGRCFGVRSLSSFSFFFPLSFSGPAWVLFLSLLRSCRTGPQRWVEAGPAQHLLVICLFFLFSLPGVGSPSSLPFSFSFFSLSLLHALASWLESIIVIPQQNRRRLRLAVRVRSDDLADHTALVSDVRHEFLPFLLPMLGDWPPVALMGDGVSGRDSGEWACHMATTSKEGRRRTNYPILPQGDSDEQ